MSSTKNNEEGFHSLREPCFFLTLPRNHPERRYLEWPLSFLDQDLTLTRLRGLSGPPE
jgi:hypothetical protein